MADETEIRAKLRLDDFASSVLDKIKQGFQEVSEQQEKTESGFLDFARQTAATALGVNFMPMIRGATNMATSFFRVANAAHDTQQGFAGLIAGMSGVPWAEARSEAERLHRTLTDISVEIGQASDDVIAGFSQMTTFLGGTTDAFQVAERNMRGIVTIANVTGVSAQELSMQFGKMASGFLSTESAVFNLFKTTGIFAKDIAKVNSEWQQLTQEERVRRLEAATAKIAGNLGQAEPTFTDLVTSMKEVGHQMLESLGEPVVKTLIPILQDLRESFMENREEIEGYARDMGRDVARWVKDASKDIEAGFEYIKTHKEEIKDAIVEAFNHAKSVVQFILDHKEELALAFGAKAASPVIGPVAKAGGKAVAGVAKAGFAGTSAIFGAAGVGGIAGATVALGAFAAAIGGVTLAIDQAVKLWNETGGGLSDAERNFNAIQERFEQMAKDPALSEWSQAEMKHFEVMRENIVALAEELDKDSRAAGELADAAFEAHRSARQQVMIYDQMASTMRKLEESGGLEGLDLGPMVERFTAGFQNAIQAGDMATARYIASTLANAKGLHTAFLNSSALTAEGFQRLAEMVKDQAGDFAEQLSALSKKEAAATAGAKAAAPKISMSGGQVFKIQQDFRDQDPDRVAIVFQRDISRAAERRIAATTSSPFGT